MKFGLSFGAVAAIVLLGACGADGAPEPPAQADIRPEISGVTPGDTCGTTRYGQWIGADRATAESVAADLTSEGSPARVTGPGIAASRDLDVERINLELDGTGRVLRLTCG